MKLKRAEWAKNGFIRFKDTQVGVFDDSTWGCSPFDTVSFGLFGFQDPVFEFDGVLELSIHPFYRVEGAP